MEARENLGDHIVVDMQYGSAQTANVVLGGRGGVGGPRGNRYFATGNGGRQALAHRRPSTLLRRLIDEPGFSNSQQIIEVPGRAPTTVRELFVHFTTIVEGHVPTFHGYWGFISDAKQGPDGEIWLNTTQSWRDFSVLISADLAARFVARFNVHDLEDLAGAYVLVFEHLSKSQGGKLYVALTELDTISVYQP
ncbi:hypothetical protein J5T34_12170 [Cupriavidus gilardii]|uniref:hypothetical protein n=1 Tax=Cupriavidus gilardii TaxID=82541 RepID=UPI001ABE4466|nr:hypothetical protein [Cupriavidus gilardii]MBO4121480.1 hypothetical protein [Cupriavidus gilardii]